ncbi:Midasin [Ophiocordyceps camponoti-floridani]|uniref:Midasin n=1 Tax=Ophiocordyceps camponoti-floridani TaxID=2030778 RepID=A0A8H4VDM0_9HYPO|nr:Midasin [Ophiocordyceps camponoti-floridani]
MVTLHLNEQTDAKTLIGLYSTNSRPGNFEWRPGVLTTAVREGRWVLIEDLDRAPIEVMSLLLPLIERRELLLPSRGVTYPALRDFRLFATIRTASTMDDGESLPNLVGMRLWKSLYVAPQAPEELENVILQMYPILRKFLPGILAVYQRLSRLAGSLSVMSRGRSVVDRQISLRDLLKWCRRLTDGLIWAGSVSGEEPISESTRDCMFMDALDCFVGSCPDAGLGKELAYAIAEEMHISRDRAEHYLCANIPVLDDGDAMLGIGRAWLRKNPLSRRLSKSKRPFASTTHSKRLLEQIARAVKLEEPILLVGETGIGKTTVVQQLAESLGHKLIAVNLSQQSEAGDLLGGFKPVNARSLATPLKEEFEALFAETGISASKNEKYLGRIGKSFAKGQWSRVSKLWREATQMFDGICEQYRRMSSPSHDDDAHPAKRRKTISKLEALEKLRPRWSEFSRKLDRFDMQEWGVSGNVAFSFIEGNLVKAIRNGDWVLLDEINLASPDTLETIADLLTGPDERPSILLAETGDLEKIVAHPSFRIFGAMNPATDVGKRDLPVGIRSRFTELYVRSPDADHKDLLTIVKAYLGSSSGEMDRAADDMTRLYLNTKRMAEEKRLVDGANEVPHFSLRTLTRVLSYVTSIAPFYGLRRALYEGFSMGFLTLLDRESESMLLPLIHHHLLDKHGNPQSLLSQTPQHAKDGRQYVRFRNQNRDRQYWLVQGEQTPIERQDYIITPFVERNLLNLVRATSTGQFPILIQGPTSAGKTSMIEYLANFSGNTFVRINNHEHTDLQEYLGTYVSGPDGQLRFQEGLLVQAMRKGYWIVLDELNLAPTEVLEALNRLLDDNRELLIPETQEVVRPHDNFILFATQNPPGLYGGRKVLSRAFRNRFLELHFDDIPEDELEHILQQRCRNTSPPDCRRIVNVYKELSRLRQSSRLFESKDSFATLRDLFRWALRDADTRYEIAVHGFMLLAERVRNDEERSAVKEVIEKMFKIKIVPDELYSETVAPELKRLVGASNSQNVVWTHAMRRLYVLVCRAIQNNEPVLLVGETGCGKTTVCQMIAEAAGKQLAIVNAHQNTETGDLIGSQRPNRNRGAVLDALSNDLGFVLETLGLDVPNSAEARLQAYRTLHPTSVAKLPPELVERVSANEAKAKVLFQWYDGALVEAMRGGYLFLLDEISLADDSVLERLNSVLEPQRTLLLAEKGVDNPTVVACDGFQFLATMNPGGDFGKKELSPALRNRFTEIWVPPLSESRDIQTIVQTKLLDGRKYLADAMVRFATWFGQTFRPMATTPISVRELLAWVQFINSSEAADHVESLVHGASAIFIDSIGASPSAMVTTDPKAIHLQRQECLQMIGDIAGCDALVVHGANPELVITPESLIIGKFRVPRCSTSVSSNAGFAFQAPTTRLNAMRIIRALQTRKPILLEGNPGVGKTSLVAAISQACGRPLTRINLSDQTDLMDLFGTDMPVEGEEAGNFAWRDAPFLQAMQKGEWVLLDEMNLASQSVLEGLNACLDHRGEVYVSELDQVFRRHPDFRLFAAQNPHHQGGGRKGLPASFVNRFIVVYADVFQDEDLKLIAAHNFPGVNAEDAGLIIDFISQLDHKLSVERAFGLHGGPWEFNLRDVLRWLDLLDCNRSREVGVDDFLQIIVGQRFRTQEDRDEVDRLFGQLAGRKPRIHSLYHDVNSTFSQVGQVTVPRNPESQPERLSSLDFVAILPELESVMMCAEKKMPCILSGPSGSGKSALLKYAAALAGKSLVVFPLNADTDTMDLVGGFEQADPLRDLNSTLRCLCRCLQEVESRSAPAEMPTRAFECVNLLENYFLHGDDARHVDATLRRVDAILGHVERFSEVDANIGFWLEKARKRLREQVTSIKPMFKWLDGVIVEALQTGQWLVLDHANLCNASVLDRLNSLLEPNGFLCVNECCDPQGNPKMVQPHPDFRVFLTVDPSYGELSRAMRNRAIEVNLGSRPTPRDPCFDRISEVESGLWRFRNVIDYCERLSSESCTALMPAGECLSVRDVALLPRFMDRLPCGDERGVSSLQVMTELMGFLRSPAGMSDLQRIENLYSTLPEQSQSLAAHQPIHALINPYTLELLPSPKTAEWAGLRFDHLRDVYDLEKTYEQQCGGAHAAKPWLLTRLQRSMMRDRVTAVAKDSTAQLCWFMTAAVEALRYHLALDCDPSSFSGRSHLCRFVTHWLDQTIVLSSGMTFSEARFQAHLELATEFLRPRTEGFSDLQDSGFSTKLLRLIKDNFSSGFQLSTGLSMERLWLVFRIAPFPDETVFQRSMGLARLADRFDAIRWKAGASIPDLARAHETFEQAYAIVRSGRGCADELVSDLTTAIGWLESHIGDGEADLEPFFAREFEYIRQLSLLVSPAHGQSTQGSSLAVLSGVSTKANMTFAVAEGPAAALQSVDCLACQDHHIWDGKLAASVWLKLQYMSTVKLGSLSLLESELPVLGRCISGLGSEIASDPLVRLNELLWQLLSEVFVAHEPQLGELVASARLLAVQHLDSVSSVTRTGLGDGNSPFDDILGQIGMDHLRQISRDHLIPAVVGIAAAERDADERAHYSALAWIQFSVGLVKLYVPNRAFDPHLRLLVGHEFFEGLQMRLREKVSALRSFQRYSTGQDTSRRIELLEKELLESARPRQDCRPVHRPDVSEVDRLHVECSNVLKLVTRSGIPSLLRLLGSSSSAEESSGLLQSMEQNVQSLVLRFSSQFEAYQDVTSTISNALRCLLVGISLCGAATASSLQTSTSQLVNATPFFGGRRWDARSEQHCRKSFEYLSLTSAAVAVEGLDGLSLDSRESILECFHSFYDDWCDRLEADRKAEEERTSLYRFRGSLEDEEEVDEREFNELFPTYDGEDGSVKPCTSLEQVRKTSLKVAEAHRNIFLDRREPVTAIREACMVVGQRVVDETRETRNVDRQINGKLLSSLTLLLSERVSTLGTTCTTEKTVNFYADPNLPEARKLVSLTQRIKTRFRELQGVDEIGHMQPLADVVESCERLLDQVHAEPLAKMIPRLEQLHALVYEWQFGGWASRVHAVLPLHDALTETIIRWRRLELATWSTLFDMEEEKCRNDAYSWWFVAYQVVIAGSLPMMDSPSELREYATSLVRSLEGYLSSSFVGQFRTRVALLRQLLSHLRLLTGDRPNLMVIYHAVQNFVHYFSRFEMTADAVIRDGRGPIEKKMKEVLLLASWKDTNINALRESARKSHMKLFRLVRKFRRVLGQDMKAIIDKGLPSETFASSRVDSKVQATTAVPDVQVESVNRVLPDWLRNHRRLARVETTVSVLDKIADGLEASDKAAGIVDDFVSSLLTWMAELQRETPKVMSDESKDKVKHLKTRKRKLLADTLRDLRTMGIRHNLPQNKLAAQGSLAIILATMTPVDASRLAGMAEADHLLHQVLDLAPKARAAAEGHSEDLTSAEVVRCVGLVEGMVEFCLSQRGSIGLASKALSSLQATAEDFRRLGNSEKLGRLRRRKRQENWRGLLPWLGQILRFAAKLVQARARLAQGDVTEVVQRLGEWAARVDAHVVVADELGQLPALVISEAHVRLEAAIAEDLESLRSHLGDLERQRPELSFILQQVHAWTHMDGRQMDTPDSLVELRTWADAVSTLIDSLLVAVESNKKTASAWDMDVDRAGWLRKHSDLVWASAQQLHMEHVDKEARRCVDLTQQIDVDDTAISAAATSIIRLASPVLDSFLELCRRCVGRGVDLHRATAHMASRLTRAFTQMASQGFCTPQEKSDESGDSGQLESGTGLGDGQGAEDISKDIQADEDLAELAQEKREGEEEEIEDEKDAVDMADEELEGELGSVNGEQDDEEGSQKGEEGEDDAEEEAGEVDDLDPAAVDEKMWDGDDEKAEKDQQGNKAAGREEKDGMMAPEEMEGKKEEKDANDDKAEEQEGQDEPDAEEEGVTAQDEMNRQDQNVEDKDALELPEEMDLDLDDKASVSSEDDLDAMSMVEEEQVGEDEARDEETKDEEVKDEEMKDAVNQETGEETDAEAEGGKMDGEDEVQEEEKPEPEPEQPNDDDEAPASADTARADAEHAAPSDVKSSGRDPTADQKNSDEAFKAEAAQRDGGEMGDSAADRDASAGNQGAASRSKEVPEEGDQGEKEERDETGGSNPFRKLGDALEKWHRQQADIQDASPDDAKQVDVDDETKEQGRLEFEHVQKDDDAGDTQAMGTAREDEVLPLDESMAIDEEVTDGQGKAMEANEEEDGPEADEVNEKGMNDMELGDDQGVRGKTDDVGDEDRSGPDIRQGNLDREDEQEVTEDDETREAIQPSPTQAERGPRDLDECRRQWTELERKTQGLSQALTWRLRLILVPTQATKMSGSFRTGKRLNIKRIIPYVASGYKRDKIWMRRSVPTKRRYQVLLCVDDSKSMGETKAGPLALEALVMVARSLAMLEAGEVGVVGFGTGVTVAHELGRPLVGEAGASALRNFSFDQERTDMVVLLRRTMEMLRLARAQQSPRSELWQLALILSDGLTPSSAHDTIRRLLRTAMEERVMIVFVVIDGVGGVLNLKEARFARGEDGESRVVVERYLDSFPFAFYLVVGRVDEVPGALGGC